MGRWEVCLIDKILMIPNSRTTSRIAQLILRDRQHPAMQQTREVMFVGDTQPLYMQEPERREFHSMCRHVPPMGVAMFREQKVCCDLMSACQPGAPFQHPTENPNEPSNTVSGEKSRLMLLSRSKDGTSPLE